MVYGTLIFCFFLFTFARVFTILSMLLKASNTIHQKMIYNILRTKAQFFDKNSIGKIMTRFSKDIGVYDYILPFKFSVFSVIVFRILSALIVIVAVNYLLIIPVTIFTILMILVTKNI